MSMNIVAQKLGLLFFIALILVGLWMIGGFWLVAIGISIIFTGAWRHLIEVFGARRGSQVE